MAEESSVSTIRGNSRCCNRGETGPPSNGRESEIRTQSPDFVMGSPVSCSLDLISPLSVGTASDLAFFLSTSPRISLFSVSMLATLGGSAECEFCHCSHGRGRWEVGLTPNLNVPTVCHRSRLFMSLSILLLRRRRFDQLKRELVFCPFSYSLLAVPDTLLERKIWTIGAALFYRDGGEIDGQVNKERDTRASAHSLFPPLASPNVSKASPTSVLRSLRHPHNFHSVKGL